MPFALLPVFNHVRQRLTSLASPRRRLLPLRESHDPFAIPDGTEALLLGKAARTLLSASRSDGTAALDTLSDRSQSEMQHGKGVSAERPVAETLGRNPALRRADKSVRAPVA